MREFYQIGLVPPPPSPRWIARLAAVLAVAVACSASPALADEPDPQARAVALYREAQQRYKDGKFAEAAELLREAYRLSPDPVLLYNLGRACEAMQDLECAVDAYQRYLDKASPPDRAAIEKRIEADQRALAERKKLQTQTTPQLPPEEKPSVVPWFVLGAGLAAATTGVVLMAVGNGQHQTAIDDPVQRSAADEQATAERTFAIGRVTLIAGLVVAAAGGTWAILDRRSTKAASPSASVGVGLGSVRLDVRF